MSDFYSDSARRRLEQLNANRAAQLADLEVHKLNGDHDSAADCIQQIADLDAARQNLVNLHQSYVAANTPQRVYETPEQKQAKPWSQMTWEDVVDLTKTSKYAKDIRPDDPNMIAGWRESQARKARNE